MRWNFREIGWRLLPGGLAAFAIVGLWKSGAMNSLEWMAYQTLFQLRGRFPTAAQVVVVAIDENSLKQLGRFPWPRRAYLKLMDILTRAEASVVAFDLLWSERSPDDIALGQALAKHGRAILATGWDGSGHFLAPVPALRTSAIATGHILNPKDADGITRQVNLQIESEPALAIAAVRVHSLVRSVVPLPPLNQPLWINWATSQVSEYSFVEVIQGRVPLSTFQNKIVLVGVTAAGLDPLSTPFQQNLSSSGVHLQATVVSNLIQQNGLRFPSHLWLGLVVAWGGPGLSLLLSCWRTQVQIAVGMGCCGVWAGCSVALLHFNYLLPVALPIALFAFTTTLVGLCEQGRMNALLRRQVHRLWQAHHPDLVNPAAALLPEPHSSLPRSLQKVNQLAALAALLGRSQSTQAAIARSLSIGLLASDFEGRIWFCNPAAQTWLQVKVGDLLPRHLIPDWLTAQQWQASLEHLQHQQAVEIQEVHRAGQWFAIRLEPFLNRANLERSTVKKPDLSPTVPCGLLLVIEEITDRKQAAIAQATLNQQLTERTVQLEAVNQELETFSYTVSHDLGAPLWRIQGFSQALLEDHTDQLDHAGRDYLRRIQTAVQRMEELIEDLLKLSRVTTTELYPERVDLSALAIEIAQELHQMQPDRAVNWKITSGLVAEGDRRLLKIALENLLSNAWKFTSQCVQAQIELGRVADAVSVSNLADSTADQTAIYFIRDNGVGFDMADAHRLFNPFQRLPNANQFSGTGIGLISARRVIHRHGGNIWAEAEINQGASFYFTLPVRETMVDRTR